VLRFVAIEAHRVDQLFDPLLGEPKIEDSQEDPFEVLIATMLSAQTRDAVTAAASARLFASPGRRGLSPGSPRSGSKS